MSLDLSQCLVIGISSRALFDLEEENDLFNADGVEAYKKYQRKNENKPLKKGTAYHLVEALLKLNELSGKKLVEVIVMSRNSPDTGLRVFKSIEHFDLDITRAAFSGGENLSDYLGAFSVDLFLSKSEEDVQLAIDSGCAAAILYAPPKEIDMSKQIRIAFDADAVIFSEESEHIYKTKGLEAFLAHEKENVNKPLPEGPFAKLLKTLSFLQEQFDDSPIRLAIVTARNSPAHERVVQTLRTWNVNVDEAFFLGGLSKDQVLKAYRAHIFFDDQDTHVEGASKLVPSGKVPYRTGSPLNKWINNENN
ncbi:MAG: 5'-nucleotidase [Arcobacter sp.]|nr:MAG: 5'-nucleotidase [Arcobacter sp.]